MNDIYLMDKSGLAVDNQGYLCNNCGEIFQNKNVLSRVDKISHYIHYHKTYKNKDLIKKKKVNLLEE